MASSAPKTTIDSVLLLFGYFVLLCALALLAAAGWYAYRRHVESSRWPVAPARLSDCRVRTTYDSWNGRSRSLNHIECVLQYEADGLSRTVTSRVGDTVSVVRGQIEITLPAVTLGALEQWVHRHPSGATEPIHYDPANPERVSLVGVDDGVSTKTPAAYLGAAATFALIGAGLSIAGVLVRRRRGRAAQ